MKDFGLMRLAAKFEMKDLGLMHYFLGLEVWQSPESIFLNEGKYTIEILKRFDMLECKSNNTPMETKLNLLVDTSSDFTLSGYTDAYWAGSVSVRKITSRSCFSLGSTMISWKSRK